MKRFVKVTLAMTGISAFYIVLSAVLAFTEDTLNISLRTWADALGRMIAALVTPLLVIVTLAVWVHGRTRIHPAVKGVLTLVAGAGYLFWAYWAVLFIIFGVQEERMIAPGLLVTNEASFLSPSEYVYYRPVAVFFKMPAELTDEIKIQYLEKKYNRKFVTDVSESGFVCDREFPEVRVSVYLTGMELRDDYAKQIALKYLAEGYEALGIERGYHITEVYGGKADLLYLEYDGESDIQALSEDLSQMISYCVGSTELFREYSGSVGVSSDWGDHEIAFTLPFGKLQSWTQQWWDKEEDYYRDSDCIAEIVAEQYAYYADQYARMDEQAQQVREEETEVADEVGISGKTEVSGETDDAEMQADSVEEGARALYDAVLADEGFSYDVDYNAKGNFYVDLGEKDGYSYSLVYDHPSKNGACELYVLYKHTGDGVANDAIIDMYAVDNATKKVAASGRKHWSDVGTKEYREMTEGNR